MSVPATNWPARSTVQRGTKAQGSLRNWFVMPGTPAGSTSRQRQQAFVVTQVAATVAVVPMVASLLLAAAPTWSVATGLLIGQAAVFPLLPLLQRWTGAVGALGLFAVFWFHGLVFATAYNFGGLMSPALLATPIAAIVCVLFLPRHRRLLGLAGLPLGFAALGLLQAAGHSFPANLMPGAVAPVAMTWLLSALAYITAMTWFHAELRGTAQARLRQEIAGSRELVESLQADWRQTEQTSQVRAHYLEQLGHELALPVQAMVGFSQVIAAESGDGPEQQRFRACAQDIESSGQRLLEALHAVEEFGKALAGALTLKMQPVDMRDIVARSLTRLAPLAHSAGLHPDQQLPPGPVMVQGDPERLQQMLDCLLSNAVRFNRRGGRLRVALLDGGGRAALVIEDGGVGMTPGSLDALRRRLQAAANGQGPGSGSGHGLLLAEMLVRAHGGWLKIDSERDKGTRVQVMLPGTVADSAEGPATTGEVVFL